MICCFTESRDIIASCSATDVHETFLAKTRRIAPRPRRDRDVGHFVRDETETRRNRPRPKTRRRDLLGRDRPTRDPRRTFPRPRRDVSTSRDGLVTETSRPRPTSLTSLCSASAMKMDKRNEVLLKLSRTKTLLSPHLHPRIVI